MPRVAPASSIPSVEISEEKPKDLAQNDLKKASFILPSLFALIFLISTIIFLVLFVYFSERASNLEEELERIRGHEANNASDSVTFSCEWMRTCSRKFDIPPLLVVSMDGFAERYLKRKQIWIMNQISKCGVRADYVIPSFPAKTFVNHYTIASGLYADAHGFIDNWFYKNDELSSPNVGKFFSGEPIWNTVVKAGKVVKTYFWVGSYDKIGGIEASETIRPYNSSTPFGARIEKVVSWLKAPSPPALSMLYMEQPDSAAHTDGPDSAQVNQALNNMDATIGFLLRRLKDEGLLGCINVVLLADHGMRKLEENMKKNFTSLAPHIAEHSNSIAKNNVLLYNLTTTNFTELQCKKGEIFRLYEQKSIPTRMHYDHPNLKWPFILGNPGVMFSATTNKGNHGWDNMDELMRTIFIGIGPSFKENLRVPPFQNIEFYNLFADLMKLENRAPNNGTLGRLHAVLKEPPPLDRPVKTSLPACVSSFSTETCAGNCTTDGLAIQPSGGVISIANPKDECKLNVGHAAIIYDKQFEHLVATEAFLSKRSTSKPVAACGIALEQLGPVCSYPGNSTTLALLPNSIPGASLLVTQLEDASDFLATLWREVLAMVERKRRKSRVRFQAGPIYGENGSLRYVFVALFACRGDDFDEHKEGCEKDEDIQTLSFILPNLESDFNCLKQSDFLMDHRVTFADIERRIGVRLLSTSIAANTYYRVLTTLPNALW